MSVLPGEPCCRSRFTHGRNDQRRTVVGCVCGVSSVGDPRARACSNVGTSVTMHCCQRHGSQGASYPLFNGTCFATVVYACFTRASLTYSTPTCRLTLNFDAAWRWESCFLPGCVAVAWATMWLYPSVRVVCATQLPMGLLIHHPAAPWQVAASVACLLAVVVVLHERAVMMLRVRAQAKQLTTCLLVSDTSMSLANVAQPFVGLPMSGFRKYGRTTLRVCDDDLRGEALTEVCVYVCGCGCVFVCCNAGFALRSPST